MWGYLASHKKYFTFYVCAWFKFLGITEFWNSSLKRDKAGKRTLRNLYSASYGFTLNYFVQSFIVIFSVGLLYNDEFNWMGKSDDFMPGLPIVYFVLAMVFVFWTEGVEFKSTTMEVRKYDAVFIFPFGKWLPLPEPEYYSLSHTLLFSGEYTDPRLPKVSLDIFSLYLVNEESDERCLIYFSENYPDCFILAQQLAARKDVPVYYQYGQYNEVATEDPPFS